MLRHFIDWFFFTVVVFLFSFLFWMFCGVFDAKANQLTTTNSNQASAGGGGAGADSSGGTQNQVVNVIVPPTQQVHVITKTYYKTKVKKTNVYHYNPNRLQLLVGVSKTKQEVTQDGCGCTLTAKRVYEPDAGLQYLRDFGSFTGSIMATKNESFYLGLGFNW